MKRKAPIVLDSAGNNNCVVVSCSTDNLFLITVVVEGAKERYLIDAICVPADKNGLKLLLSGGGIIKNNRKMTLYDEGDDSVRIEARMDDKVLSVLIKKDQLKRLDVFLE